MVTHLDDSRRVIGWLQENSWIVDYSVGSRSKIGLLLILLILGEWLDGSRIELLLTQLVLEE